jgi:sugar phosphate isomerase/epimerase
MEIGTFARASDQVRKAIEFKPDFVELRLDVGHDFDLRESCEALGEAGIACTLHLPSHPEWQPMDLSQGLAPYIDLGRLMDARLVTFHTTLSTLFYEDEDIDVFLESLPAAYDAAVEADVPIAIETLGLYYTELSLLFERFPKLKMVLDLGHGQILTTMNRSLAHIESFGDYIEMVNVHDNNGGQMVQEIINLKKQRAVSRGEMRELALKYDTHNLIGKGSIDFDSIFRLLKSKGYDKRFLMIGGNPEDFEQEREAFMKRWLEA